MYMSKKFTHYNLLISCPGDVKEEIEVIEKIVARFNEQFSDVLDIYLRTKHWSKNSYPESGGSPQKLLNKQFVNDCDAAIAIFWTRFGTPTDDYGSGTEEEIEEMLKSGKQVFLYFSDKPLPVSQATEINSEYNRILEFKKQYESRGIHWSYNSNDDLDKLLFAHLSQHFLSLEKIQEIEAQKTSKLIVKSITTTEFSENLEPCKFGVLLPIITDDILREITELFDKIKSYDIFETSPIENYSSIFDFYKPVEISDHVQKTITAVAEALAYELPENFFSLGSLCDNTMSALTSLGVGRDLKGTATEKEKYNNIHTLNKKIYSHIGWSEFENLFKNLSCIRLAVINDGTTFDEDIEITLTFPSEMIILHRDLPIPAEDTIQHIEEDSSLYKVFGIAGTAKYNDFESSKTKNMGSVAPYIPRTFPFGAERDYTEKYLDDLDDIFEYQIFSDDNFKTIKLHIDYLKHNTAVAFPSVIFVTDKISDISYSISSKHGATVISGTINVQ